MNVRRRLVGGFLATTVFSLFVFSLISHRVALDLATMEEAVLLSEVTEALAQELSALDSKEMQRRLAREQETHIQWLAHDPAAKTPLATIDFPELTSENLQPVLSTLDADPSGHGSTSIRGWTYLWARAPIADSGLMLYMFHRESPHETSLTGSLGVRLLIIALFVTWLAVWVALIISRRIVQGLDEKNAALRHMVLHDDLTGLPNRSSLYQLLQQLISRRDNHSHRNLALLVLDINRFKEINDTLGHIAGDELLVQIGQRLKQGLPDARLVARLGGDEFAIVVDSYDPGAAVATSEEICALLHSPCTLHDLDINVECSIGAAMFPQHAESADTLIKRAEVAMYQAKQTHARYLSYAAEFDPYSVRRLTLMGEMRQAIEKEQLVLHFQPKVSLANQRTVGVETLVRWQHPQFGLVPPGEFISLAEQSDLIGQLTMWVMEQAIIQARCWRDQGWSIETAVNLSARNLADQRLPEKIAELLNQHRLPSAQLKLEITESIIMSEPERALDTLTQLHAMGVKLSVDDYGTGYSSLTYLKKLPVSEIKIDRAFIKDMLHDESDRVIVESTIELAHRLGCQLVAEGIEDEQTYQELLRLNCDTAQGYHIARPLSVADFQHWLLHDRWPCLKHH